MSSLKSNTMNQTTLAPVLERERAIGRWKDYLELTKPRLSAMAIVTVIVGFVCGSTNVLQFSFFAVVIGSALSAGGAAAINQWFESDIDSKMHRTKDRPIPSGKVTRSHALYFGCLLSVLGCVLLGFGTNVNAAMISALCILTYVALYTPLKTKTPLATEIGAFPGALPPLIGWVGATNNVNGWGLYLFLLLLTWQMPHFMAIAWAYKEDYQRGGIQVTCHNDDDARKTASKAIFWSILLLCLPTYGFLTQLLNPLEWIIHTLFCSYLLLLSLRFHRATDKKSSSKKLFFGSIIFLPVYLILITIQETVFA